MADPGRTHAGFSEPIVEPRSRAIAEVGADDLMDRREDLQQHERNADQGQRLGEAGAELHRGDQLAHRNGEDGGQKAAGDQDHPPGDSQSGIGARQHGEELPFVPGA